MVASDKSDERSVKKTCNSEQDSDGVWIHDFMLPSPVSLPPGGKLTISSNKFHNLNVDKLPDCTRPKSVKVDDIVVTFKAWRPNFLRHVVRPVSGHIDNSRSAKVYKIYLTELYRV